MAPEHKKIAGWILLGILLFFILINLEPVEVNFFFVLRVKMPVAFVLFVSAAMGAAAVYGIQFYRKHRKEDEPLK
jgi:uncharacterized integral membrane protein